MAIDVKDTGLDTKLGASSGKADTKSLTWDDVADGTYNGELVVVYPWKEVTHETTQRAKDADGKYLKDAEGNFVKEDIGTITWSITDAVFRIIDGAYENFAVKGTFSTHPDMIGSAKKFLYSAKLYDVSLRDLYKHAGVKVTIHVKHKKNSYKDKKTGQVNDEDIAYISYYSSYDDTAVDGATKEDLGI